MQFPGLTAEHLDNYREPKSRSNVYSRARLEIKEWLMGLSGPLVERLRAQGHSLEVLASDHHPSLWNQKLVDRQWIFFSRGAEDRASLERIVDHDRSLASTLMDPTPFFKYAFVCMALSEDGLEAAVMLHHRAWVDRDNFLARMADADQREAFLEILRNLPEEYAFGLAGQPLHPVGSVTPGVLSEVLDGFVASEGMLRVGLGVDPRRTVELGEDLFEVVSVAFLLLSPVYSLFSWDEEDDWISLADREQAIDLERRAVSLERQAQAQRYESLKRERQVEQARRFEEQRAAIMDQQAYQERMRRNTLPVLGRQAPQPEREAPEVEPPRPAQPPARAAETARAEPRAPARREPDRPRPRRRMQTMREVPFEVQPGVRVEITAGVLRGKWGIVQEVDRHGQAKVVLGSLVARIPVDQLTAPRSQRR